MWACLPSSSSTAKFKTVFLPSFISGILSFLSNWFLKVLRGLFYWRDACANVNPERIECNAFCSSFVLYFARDFYSGQSCFFVERILHEGSVARPIFHLNGKTNVVKATSYFTLL